MKLNCLVFLFILINVLSCLSALNIQSAVRNARVNTTTVEETKCVKGRNIGDIKQKIQWIPNPDLDYLSDGEISALTKFEKCKEKTGLIYMIEKEKSYQSELKLVKIYVKATAEKIEFFQSEKESSKFYEVLQKNLIRFGNKLEKSTCIDIVTTDELSHNQQVLNKIKKPNDVIKYVYGSLTICGISIREQRMWLKHLLSLKECTTGGPELLADYSAVNHQLQTEKDKNIRKDDMGKNIRQGRFYNNQGVYNQFTPITPQKGTKTVILSAEPITKVAKAVEDIKKTIKESDKKKELIKKKLTQKIYESRENVKKIAKQKEIIQELRQHTADIQKKQQLETVETLHLSLQTKQMKEAAEKMKKVREEMLKKLKEKIDNKIKNVKNDTNKKAKDALTCLKNEEKNEDYGACITSKLEEFKDQDYIKSQCMEMWGENGLDKCVKYKSFCNMCCSFYVGDKFLKKRDVCIKSCTVIIKPKVHWRGRMIGDTGIVYPTIAPWPLIKWRGVVIDPNKQEPDNIKPKIDDIVYPEKGDIKNMWVKIINKSTQQPVMRSEYFDLTFTAKQKEIGDRKQKVPEVSEKAQLIGDIFVFYNLYAGDYEIQLKSLLFKFDPSSKKFTITQNGSDMWTIELEPVVYSMTGNVVRDSNKMPIGSFHRSVFSVELEPTDGKNFVENKPQVVQEENTVKLVGVTAFQKYKVRFDHPSYDETYHITSMKSIDDTTFTIVTVTSRVPMHGILKGPDGSPIDPKEAAKLDVRAYELVNTSSTADSAKARRLFLQAQGKSQGKGIISSGAGLINTMFKPIKAEIHPETGEYQFPGLKTGMRYIFKQEHSLIYKDSSVSEAIEKNTPPQANVPLELFTSDVKGKLLNTNSKSHISNLEGFKIKLTGKKGNQDAKILPDGTFEFKELLVGEFNVEVMSPQGYQNSKINKLEMTKKDANELNGGYTIEIPEYTTDFTFSFLDENDKPSHGIDSVSATEKPSGKVFQAEEISGNWKIKGISDWEYIVDINSQIYVNPKFPVEISKNIDADIRAKTVKLAFYEGSVKGHFLKKENSSKISKSAGFALQVQDASTFTKVADAQINESAFTVPNIKSGKYNIDVKTGHGYKNSPKNSLTFNKQTGDQTLLIEDYTTNYNIKLVGENNQSIADEVQQVKLTEQPSGKVFEAEKKDGNWVVQGVSDWTYTLSYTSRTYQDTTPSFEIKKEGGKTGEEISLPLYKANVKGKFVDETGKVIDKQGFAVTLSSDNGQEIPVVKIKDDGTWEIPELKSGQYNIKVIAAPGYKDSDTNVLTMNKDQGPITLQISPYYTDYKITFVDIADNVIDDVNECIVTEVPTAEEFTATKEGNACKFTKLSNYEYKLKIKSTKYDDKDSTFTIVKDKPMETKIQLNLFTTKIEGSVTGDEGFGQLRQPAVFYLAADKYKFKNKQTSRTYTPTVTNEKFEFTDIPVGDYELTVDPVKVYDLFTTTWSITKENASQQWPVKLQHHKINAKFSFFKQGTQQALTKDQLTRFAMTNPSVPSKSEDYQTEVVGNVVSVSNLWTGFAGNPWKIGFQPEGYEYLEKTMGEWDRDTPQDTNYDLYPIYYTQTKTITLKNALTNALITELSGFKVFVTNDNNADKVYQASLSGSTYTVNDVPSGDYTITVESTRFVKSNDIKFSVKQKYATNDVIQIMLSPAVASNQWRMILSWNTPHNVKDLDSYSDIVNSDNSGSLGSSYRCNYSVPTVNYGSSQLHLDHDEQHKPGPETLTWTLDLTSNITYRYYVKYYTYRSGPDSNYSPFDKAEATVTIIQGNTIRDTVKFPKAQARAMSNPNDIKKWSLFTYNPVSNSYHVDNTLSTQYDSNYGDTTY